MIVPLSAGIPEDLLVGQLEALAPQSARDMLGMLVGLRLLRVQTGPAARRAPPPIFGADPQVDSLPPVRCWSVSLHCLLIHCHCCGHKPLVRLGVTANRTDLTLG